MMPNTVLRSIENSYGDYCIDFFERADGTFGFEEYRSDPEDGATWHSLHRYQGRIFSSEGEALAAAKSCVPWLKAV